ncbi:transposase [Ligilactobacillus salivarius]|uniref:transposase n=1 Tax=Ligilactobacillus salivarius TaxID=1624 RepID=UPI000BB00259|nr:transposase [Ligilactobacillus salivarius]
MKLKIRICKFRINEPGTEKEEWEVLLTNLDKVEFPLEKIKYLYHLRWRIETEILHYKYDIGKIQFHSKKDDFVYMEIYAGLMLFNMVSSISEQVSIDKEKRKHKH